jgi:hypothetical protein
LKICFWKYNILELKIRRVDTYDYRILMIYMWFTGKKTIIIWPLIKISLSTVTTTWEPGFNFDVSDISEFLLQRMLLYVIFSLRFYTMNLKDVTWLNYSRMLGLVDNLSAHICTQFKT